MSGLLISVVVPCYNASERVVDTLSALAYQTCAPDRFEVLVIDNNSSDSASTRALVAALNQRSGNFRYLNEAKPGLNEVRRAGAEQARGEYVMYIDDDAVPLCSYVERLVQAIGLRQPDVIGGSLLAFPEAPIDRRFDQSFGGWWSLRHFGPADRWLGRGEYFLGANIGARRSILVEHGFDPSKDRKGAALLGGGEVWLGDSIYQRWYCANAPVFHKVSLPRMEKDYLSRRMLSNLTANQAVASWPDIIRTILRSFYTPLKTALVQISFRLSLALKVCAMKIGSPGTS